MYVRTEVENRKRIVFRIDSHAVNGNIGILTFEARMSLIGSGKVNPSRFSSLAYLV